MRRRYMLCGLIVAVPIGGSSSPVKAQVFPWWAIDSVARPESGTVTLSVTLSTK